MHDSRKTWVFQRKHWASEGSRRMCLPWELWEGQASPPLAGLLHQVIPSLRAHLPDSSRVRLPKGLGPAGLPALGQQAGRDTGFNFAKHLGKSFYSSGGRENGGLLSS